MDSSFPRKLTVLDLCTGTGCIPLLFTHELYKHLGQEVELNCTGIDLSQKATRLARRNQQRQLSAVKETSPIGRTLSSMHFIEADVLSVERLGSDSRVPSVTDALRTLHTGDKGLQYGILISNPPYISPLEFDNTTSRSVRNFEPKLALVPPSDAALSGIDQGDVFYPRLLAIAEEVGAKLVLLEVADLTQARRVATMAYERRVWDGIEIWRDDPDEDLATGDLFSVGGDLMSDGYAEL
ncbi:hypothetical protein LTR66_009993 [Elasticomyces elasticus]|nr:hypothetical protein LTR66_009993 [Elasticomyces elasticus]